MLRVVPVKALEDNYMYIVYDEVSKIGAAVDPVEPNKVEAEAKRLGVKLAAALVTHHHWDHAGGMKAFREIWNDKSTVPIYGGDDRIDCLDVNLKHEQKFAVGPLKVRALSTPCHTRGHICYDVVPLSSEPGAVLTGDTLFIAGCGRFFEGDAKQMHWNLNEALASLPPTTRVYPGHEYTTNNLKFAKSIEPENTAVLEKLKWSQEQDAKGEPTVPSTIAEELTFNPFMRVNQRNVQAKVGLTDPVAVMQKLRDLKNAFKA